MVETVFDGLNAKAALYAIDKIQTEKATRLPVMISATINDKSGRTLTGQSLEALYTALAPVSYTHLVATGIILSEFKRNTE